MKEGKARRSNAERSDATRGVLIAAARKLFAEKGYAATGTPEVVAEAGVTRGALYHQFRDKADLLLAVLLEEARAVTQEIELASSVPPTPRDGLLAGAIAYFDAMSAPGRARLLLVEAPAALGAAALAQLEKEAGALSLREGLEEVLGDYPPAELDALAEMLSIAFDRAALRIAQGDDRAPYEASIKRILAAL